MVETLLNAAPTVQLLPLVILITLVAVIAGIAARLLSGQHRYRYKSNRYLMTRSENAFFSALQKAFGDHYLIFSKVRIADVLTPDYRNATKVWWRAFVRISSKHVDFVLIDKRTRKITACVELDDASHRRLQRKKRDALVNAAFQSAQLPLLRIPAAKYYDTQHLQSLLP